MAATRCTAVQHRQEACVIPPPHPNSFRSAPLETVFLIDSRERPMSCFVLGCCVHERTRQTMTAIYSAIEVSGLGAESRLISPGRIPALKVIATPKGIVTAGGLKGPDGTIRTYHMTFLSNPASCGDLVKNALQWFKTVAPGEKITKIPDKDAAFKKMVVATAKSLGIPVALPESDQPMRPMMAAIPPATQPQPVLTPR